MAFIPPLWVLTELETLGLPIQINELDVNSAQGGQRNTGADIANNTSTTQGGLVSDADKPLADAYAGLFRAFVKHKSVKIVTFWGSNDANSREDKVARCRSMRTVSPKRLSMLWFALPLASRRSRHSLRATGPARRWNCEPSTLEHKALSITPGNRKGRRLARTRKEAAFAEAGIEAL